MIRYPIARPIEELIDAHAPGWRDRARTRTEAIVAAGRYEEASPIWSEVKTVFMRLQHHKCAYCERQLAAPGRGEIEHDLEHFRPKSAVRRWPGADAVRFRTGTDDAVGYHWLAYHPGNYATACKPRNSALKDCYFPVAGTRGTVSATPEELDKIEKPLLIYPLGEGHDDPEELMRFNGMYAVAAHSSGYRHRMAVVTILFFKLNDDNLYLERARFLAILGTQLRTRTRGRTKKERADAAEVVDWMCQSDFPHANCNRSLVRLHDAAPEAAQQRIEEAQLYLRSRKDETLPPETTRRTHTPKP